MIEAIDDDTRAVWRTLHRLRANGWLECRYLIDPNGEPGAENTTLLLLERSGCYCAVDLHDIPEHGRSEVPVYDVSEEDSGWWQLHFDAETDYLYQPSGRYHGAEDRRPVEVTE